MRGQAEVVKDKKTTIALIDSGIDESSQIKAKIKYKYNLSEEKTIVDGHGHSTALIGMLDEFCGDSIELIIIKVLNDQCRCSSKTLLEALDMAIELKPDIINLSLGTDNLSLRREFEARCDQAFSKDIVLVTTTVETSDTLPFMIEKTVKVKSHENIIEANQLYLDKKSVFYTLGIPHIVPWKNGKYVFINRNSFVTPYFISKFVEFKNSHDLNNYSILREVRGNCVGFSQIQLKEIKVTEPIDQNLYNRVISIISQFIPNIEGIQSTFTQGLNINNCIDVLMKVEKTLGQKLPFAHFNLYDFTYVSNLSNKIKGFLV
ncbi:S8 family serine peptidase [Paenibacillus durus]|uniref:Peptidase S8/S53 domain-containing protein n=1 Tax=Paenibacillus durus ATCC 35681 TaxID=1333534 RepID=A0A0F7F6N7_PAEDU|nr:S8 family serine peptidase [Paenibacillus durus]AKG33382.1 hypothetical protein VK70_01120 [Paenibacillus durus ATCC 35681]